MKKLLFYAVSVAAVCCHGGFFDSALKGVNKAAEIVNAVDEARKPPAEAPQQEAQQSPAAAESPVAVQPPAAAEPAQDAASVDVKGMSWDAAGYQAKVAKVNAAMQEVAPKLPFNGDLNDWYNAAYELTTTERQYSFLPIDQRISRISENDRVNIDKFIGWVDDGMQVFDSNAEAAEAQRAAAEKAAEEQRMAAARQAAEEERLAAERQAAEEQRMAALRKAAEEERIAAEKAAEERRMAAERQAAEEQRMAESRKAAEKTNEEFEAEGLASKQEESEDWGAKKSAVREAAEYSGAVKVKESPEDDSSADATAAGPAMNVDEFKKLSVEDRASYICNVYTNLELWTRELYNGDKRADKLLTDLVGESALTPEFLAKLLVCGEFINPETNHGDYNNDLEQLKEFVVKKVPDSMLFDVTLKFIEEMGRTGYCRGYFGKLLGKQKGRPEFGKIVDAIPNDLAPAWVGKLLDNIEDPKLADKLFDKKLPNDDYTVMTGFINKLSPEKKQSLIRRAKARAQAVARTSPVIGWFYPGMPFIDYRLLREDSGFEKSAGLMNEETTWVNDSIKEKGDWQEGYVICGTIFSTTEMMNFVECADVAVFDQIIHQFILKKSGTVDRYTYGNEYGMSYGELSESVKFNYRNTKLNISATYWVSDGDIRIQSINDDKAIASVRDIVLKTTEKDYDESAGFGGGSASGGGFFNFVLFVAIVCAALYFFRKKIDAFVATHPKYEKAWASTCKAGNAVSKTVKQVVSQVETKIKEAKAKKTA